MKQLKPVMISGREVLPIIEGGKGVAISTGQSSGAFAAAGAVGTFSAVNADSYDVNGRRNDQVYVGTTRRQRFEELVAFAIQGGIAQARIAADVAGGEGRIHLNVLWEAGGTEHVLPGVLEGARGLVHGVTCGAGMPYRVADIAAKYGVYYHPIVSSARAFRALWKRSYSKIPEWLGSVVYEDPWRAGGHNGLTNAENPREPQDPFPRVRELRVLMNEVGLSNVPIIMAGGVWYLRDWEDWIDNPDLGPIAFQFGTRPLLTKESPVSETWRERLLGLKKGDVSLHRFSPTGFYSSAIRNGFLRKLEERSERQVSYQRNPEGTQTAALPLGPRGRPVYVTPEDKVRAEAWIAQGFTEGMKTPDSTVVFVNESDSQRILANQAGCMGCLSACLFSNWAANEEGTTGRRADPRSFCIQKTLQAVSHGGDVDKELMFAGHNAYMFAEDPFFNQGVTPTVAELVERIKTGN
ncbi:MAG: nitronate monooxygenase [Rhodospirillales bacterium]|nr:nitronate monooxygenase [Rhodospirillales bacterium]MCW8860979.1 nitronate monooxygenase [Rhodospirillales bacterium]MCW8953086.1 nitronate monooxygenase [Rhodospirillales bacterium]MCW8970359.1 nitronate monooxygenase [Rhodospirillales bacterium]MCW9003320.1 nitronate monooxygenase [Rhodospirillales bacterium]